MSTDIRIEHIYNNQEFANLQENWDRLHSQSPIRDAFLTWEWLWTWWKHYSQNKDLWLTTAWQGEQLAGIAPLMLIKKRKYGQTFRILKALGAPDCDISGFLVHNGNECILQALCDFIISQQKHWDAIELDEFHNDDPQTLFVIKYFQKFSFDTLKIVKDHYYLPIESDWPTYFNNISGNTRNDVKRRIRRAEENGKLSYERVAGEEVKWEHFQTIFKINAAGHYPDLYAKNLERAFHHDLMERMHKLGLIEMYFLWFDEKPVAFRYGFAFEGKFEDWRNGVDMNFNQLSAGKILLKMTLEDHFNRGYREFDFLRGIDEYKARWQPQKRQFASIRITHKKNIRATIAFTFLPKFKKLLQNEINKRISK